MKSMIKSYLHQRIYILLERQKKQESTEVVEEVSQGIYALEFIRAVLILQLPSKASEMEVSTEIVYDSEN